MSVQATSASETTVPLFSKELQARLDALVETLRPVRRSAAQVGRAAEDLEIRALRGRIPELVSALEAGLEQAQGALAALEAYSIPQEGPQVQAYAQALEAEAERQNVPLQGTFPSYEAFPLTVKLELADEWVLVGRAHTPKLDPRALLESIGKQLSRLQRSAFNAQRFMKTLATYYDVLEKGQSSREVALIDIYNLMTAHSGTANYSKSEFAFDIYRLRRHSDMIYAGRRIAFHHGRRRAFVVPKMQGGSEELASMVMLPVAGDD